ncbi:MAG: arsenate reductase (glutaredoxin) [Gammaproteobacteria bacterium]|nr:arsenate reductase (glutaredoxin) [Gammaproteobacteria bacterium]
MSTVTIYHNPRCSKSRQTLVLLEEKGVKPEIILYLETPPDDMQIRKLLNMLDLDPRDLIRASEEEYNTLNLGDAGLDDDALIQAMVSHPKLIQRPIVVKDGKAVIGRPPENVLNLI